jgi:hypothetical protein
MRILSDKGPAGYGPWHLPFRNEPRCGGMNQLMTAEEIVRYMVARAVWAPSVHNTQPWRFTADGGPQVSLHADAGRRLAVADPGRPRDDDQLRGRAVRHQAGVAVPRLDPADPRAARPSPADPGGAGVLAGSAPPPTSSSGGCPATCSPGGPIAAHSIPSRCRRTHWPRSRPPFRPLNTSSATTVSGCASSPAGRPRRAAPATTECRLPPTRRGPSAPSHTSPAGISPAGTAGGCRRSARHLAPGRRHRRTAHHDRR